MIKDNVRDALNAQMVREFFSSYLYLSMSAHFESITLRGFAAWLKVQAQEELAHGMKFYEYLVDQGARVTLKAIEGPKTEWASPLDAFEHVLAHEQKVTAHIHDLADLAASEKDFATFNFLQWFVNEQVEEEANAGDIVYKLKLASVEKGVTLLLMMDHHLGKRGSK
ncbi:MAG: ferritin [Methanomicrobiales archaeon]|nr:ferritin [Methanomicrobiales archaeon]